MSDFFTQVYHPSKKAGAPVVFLDRDGTIIHEAHHLTSEKQLRIYKNAVEAIKLLNSQGFHVVAVSNQSVVARGMVSEEKLLKINDILYKRLAEKGAKISAFYSCPHHPEGVVEKYSIRCGCRKPKTLMFERAVSDFDTTLKKASLVGDMTSDIKAGENLAIPTILVKTGYGGTDRRYKVKPDFQAKNLLAAARIVAGKILP